VDPVVLRVAQEEASRHAMGIERALHRDAFLAEAMPQRHEVLLARHLDPQVAEGGKRPLKEFDLVMVEAGREESCSGSLAAPYLPQTVVVAIEAQGAAPFCHLEVHASGEARQCRSGPRHRPGGGHAPTAPAG